MKRTVGCLSLMTVAVWLFGASVSPMGVTRQTPPRRGWMAGVARINVTPREPIFLKGYGSRTKPSEGVRQELYIKALALRDETGATAVLVTSDLHSYTRRMSDTIAEGVQKKYGLSRDRLILN